MTDYGTEIHMLSFPQNIIRVPILGRMKAHLKQEEPIMRESDLCIVGLFVQELEKGKSHSRESPYNKNELRQK